MKESEKTRFAQALGTLRDCYPSYKPTEDDFRRIMRAYWQRLETLPIEAVEAAVMQAPNAEYYPDYFPSAGQLKRVAEEQYRKVERRKQQEREAETRANIDPAEELREFQRTVPVTPDGQAAYVNCGLDDWDKLARLWQCESRRLGLKPTQTTPPEVFTRRMREFWSMWERKDGEKATAHASIAETKRPRRLA